MKYVRRSSLGFALIELLLVLAIIAAVAVAAFIVYPKVQVGRSAAFEAQVLASVQANARSVFSSGNYAKIHMTSEGRSVLFPSHMFNDGLIENQWGGVGTIGPSTADGSDSGVVQKAFYFRIVYTQVPRDVCVRLAGMAAKNFGAIRIINVPHLHNGGEVVQNLYGEPRTELNEELVAENCKGEGDRAAMIFVSN